MSGTRSNWVLSHREEGHFTWKLRRLGVVFVSQRRRLSEIRLGALPTLDALKGAKPGFLALFRLGPAAEIYTSSTHARLRVLCVQQMLNAPLVLDQSPSMGRRQDLCTKHQTQDQIITSAFNISAGV